MSNVKRIILEPVKERARQAPTIAVFLQTPKTKGLVLKGR